MKKIVIAFLTISLINTPIAFAKGKGGSKSKLSSSKRSTISNRSYGGYFPQANSNTSTSSSHSEHNPPTQSIRDIPITTIKSLPITSATTTKKAGVRTCPNQHCTIISYLPKGKKVEWIELKNGFVLLNNGVHWVSKSDIK